MTIGSGPATSGATVVLVFGGPGAGAAEACAKLAAAFSCMHLSLEALMRAEVRAESETGRAIAELVRGGKLVPAHFYLTLLKGAITAGGAGTAWVVDGFPRSLDSLALLEQQLGTCSHALLLDASDATLENRLLQPPQSAEAAPAEATADGARRRVRTFNNQTLPVIRVLEARGVLKRADANGGADATFAAVSAAYKSHMGVSSR